jgi:hypothetical protein
MVTTRFVSRDDTPRYERWRRHGSPLGAHQVESRDGMVLSSPLLRRVAPGSPPPFPPKRRNRSSRARRSARARSRERRHESTYLPGSLSSHRKATGVMCSPLGTHVCHVEEKAARCHHLSGGCFPVQGECLPDRRLSISDEPSRSSRARRAARAPGVCRERTRVTRQVEGSMSPPFTTTRGRTNFGRRGASPAARSLARGARSPQRAPRPWSGSPPTRHTPQMRTEVLPRRE